MADRSIARVIDNLSCLENNRKKTVKVFSLTVVIYFILKDVHNNTVILTGWIKFRHLRYIGGDDLKVQLSKSSG